MIYPREAVDTLKTQPVGTGPFTLAQWDRGDKIVLSQRRIIKPNFVLLRPELALATLLGITPVLLVFLFAQRYLVSGLLAGATKE